MLHPKMSNEHFNINTLQNPNNFDNINNLKNNLDTLHNLRYPSLSVSSKISTKSPLPNTTNTTITNATSTIPSNKSTPSFLIPSTSPLSNDLLKYSYSYPTNQNLSSQQTKLPSISTLLSSSSSSSIRSASPSIPNSPSLPINISPPTSSSNSINNNKQPFSISAPVLRQNNNIFSSTNNRSESISSVDTTLYSRSNSLLNNTPFPYHNTINQNSSLETLTNVAQQSFGTPPPSSTTTSSSNSFSLPRNSFSNSQYFSNHASYLDYSIPKYHQPTTSSSSTHKFTLSSVSQHSDNNDNNDNSSHSSQSNPSSPSLHSSNLPISNVESPSSVSSTSTLPTSKASKKKRSNLPKQSTSILLNWLHNNLDHPYPNSKEKKELMDRTGLSPQQLSNWFINARRRKIQGLRDSK